MMPDKQQFTDEIKKYAKVLAQTFADMQYWHRRALDAVDQTEKKNKSAIETSFKLKSDVVTQNYSEASNRAKEDMASLEAGYQLAELGWEAPAWRQYQPPIEAPLPRYIRFGKLTARAHSDLDEIEFSALLPIIGGRNVLFLASGEGKEYARANIQAIVLRLLATLPPGKLRLVCIDPVGLGSTVAGFIKGLPDTLTG